MAEKQIITDKDPEELGIITQVGGAITTGRDALSSGVSDFLPAVQLLQGTSKAIREKSITVKGDSCDNTAGDFFCNIKNINLGRSTIIVVVHRRAHALFLKDKEKTHESYDQESQIFKDIIKMDQPDRKHVKMFGHDWLVYVPAIGELCTYFPCRPAARPVSAQILELISDPQQRTTEAGRDLPQTCVFQLTSAIQAFGKDNSCWVPSVSPISKEKASEDKLWPPKDKRDDAVATFMAPVKSEPKIVESTTVDDR